MVITSISCSYRTYKYSYVTRGPLLVVAIVVALELDTRSRTPNTSRDRYAT